MLARVIQLFNGHSHHYKKVDVLLTWVYVSRNWYQTDRNWSLIQDQVKKIKIFWSQKFATKKTAKNGIFGRFWHIFGTITCKLPVVQSWNFAPKFVLIDWTCTGKKKNSSISARHPKFCLIPCYIGGYSSVILQKNDTKLPRVTLNNIRAAYRMFQNCSGNQNLGKIKF